MITAVLNERYERCKKAAIVAFGLRNEIDGYESGGIEPEKRFIMGHTLKRGDVIAVAIDYTYPKTCGLSDVHYHIVDSDKKRTDIFVFINGKVYLNGGKLFEEPWLDETKRMQRDYYKEFSDVIRYA